MGCLLAGTLLVAPDVAALPLVVTGWMTYLAVTVMSRRLPERAARKDALSALLLRQTRVRFTDRLKAGWWSSGGPSDTRKRFRHADAR